MAAPEDTLDSLTPELLESRLRNLAHELIGAAGVDELEMKHLLEILTRSSLLLRQVYETDVLDRILAGERQPSSLLGPDFLANTGLTEERLQRLWSVPDVLRTCGDKCLYDIGLAGRRTYRGVALLDLGPRAYNLTSQVLELLADDRTLREFYERNLLDRLPIDEEVLFLRQCASRFRVYAQILQAFRSGEPIVAAGAVAPASTRREGASEGEAGPPAGTIPPAEEPAASPPAGAGAPPPATERFEDAPAGMSREERLTRYERAILFSVLDLQALRRRLKTIVIDQEAAVDQLCDDMAVHALGTRTRARPQSYFLVGPTGVGKNFLMETLARLLEEMWSVEVPFMILEGAQYTYPSDVGELKGSTRGFIRSDETGLLAEFHERARRAPLSVLLVDEVEKAHPQLARFFLALMDRGETMDNRGRLLRFPATLLAFTSNLGYSEQAMRARPIGYEEKRAAAPGIAARDLRRGLPPEFLNRLQVIHFAALSRHSAARILDHEVRQIAERYRRLHGLRLEVSREARQALVHQGFSEESGARHLVAAVDRACNVEVGLRLQAGPAPLSDKGEALLERIREARREARAVDEQALRKEVESEIRLRKGVRCMRIGWADGRFTYASETT